MQTCQRLQWEMLGSDWLDGSEVMGDDKGRQTTAEFMENVNCRSYVRDNVQSAAHCLK